MFKMAKDDYGYIFMACFSIALLVWIIPEYCPPWPGYGMRSTFMPNIIGCFILCLSLLGLLRNILKKIKRPEKTQAGESRRGIPGLQFMILFILPCIFFMPAISLIGFIPAGIIFMSLIQLLSGQKKVIPFILVATLPVLLFWVVMRYALGAPMP